MIVELVLLGILLFMIGTMFVGRFIVQSRARRMTDEQFRHWFSKNYLGMSAPDRQLEVPQEQSQSQRRREARARQSRRTEQTPVSDQRRA